MSDFVIPQGTDSGITWPVYNNNNQPFDFTGWTGRAQIRAFNTDKLLHSFSTGLGNLILNEGTITLTWTSAETSAWRWKQANFGLEVINTEGKVSRVIQTVVTLSKEVAI